MMTNRCAQMRALHKPSRSQSIDHTNQVYSGWRCIRREGHYCGMTIWLRECVQCGEQSRRDVNSRKTWGNHKCKEKNDV